MSNFVGTPIFLNPFIWVAMGTMHFRIAKTGLILGKPTFAVQGSI